MYFSDIQVHHSYRVNIDSSLNESNAVTAYVLAKAVVGGRESVWIQYGNASYIVNAERVYPLCINKDERIKSLVKELKFALTSPLGKSSIEKDVIKVIDNLMTEIEQGQVIWDVEK